MAQWYGLTQEEVLKRLGTNRTGLNEKEAERRLETYGENVLKEQEEMPWWQVFLGQFKDLLVMILIGAAGVSMVTGDPESALVIFSVLLLNAILGTVEHQKARKSLESLKRLASPETLLIREGRVCTAPSSRVVPGDILVLETGGMVPADGRILQSCSLTCNESSLTGEALNVEKKRGKTAGRKNAFISGRSEQYGLFRCSDHWRKGNCGSDGNRNGYPDRDHCFPDEPHSGKENTFAGQFRPVFRPSGLRNYGDLRGRSF